jgi:hypothetical protein
MNKLKAVLLFSAFVATTPSSFVYAQDAATAAGAVAATYLGVTYIPPLFTKSDLEIKVEKFIKNPMEASASDKLRFPLGRPPVVTASDFTAQQAAIVHKILGESRPDFPAAMVDLVKGLRNTNNQKHQDLVKDLQRAQEIDARIRALAQEYRNAYHRQNPTNEDLPWLRSIAIKIKDLHIEFRKQIDYDLNPNGVLASYLEHDKQAKSDIKASQESLASLQEQSLVDSQRLNAVVNTYTGGVITGPISNQAYQGLVVQGDYLDQVLTGSKGRWKTHNHCKLRFGAGNTDMIVYFEDAFTPVVKQSRYSPDQFIQAQGQFYRAALATAASVYGLPTPGSPNELNVLAHEVQKADSEKALSAAKAAQVKSLTILIDGYGKIGTADADAKSSLAASMRKQAEALK